MLSFRRIQFDNGSIIYLRPEDHERQIGHLINQMLTCKLVIKDMSVEKAAAWNYAVHLYNMPVEGRAWVQ